MAGISEIVARSFLVTFAVYVASHFFVGYWIGIAGAVCAGLAAIFGCLFLYIEG